jgi:hypothetical protein
VEGHFTFDENLDFIRVILNIIQWHRCYLNRDNGLGLFVIGIFILDNNFTKKHFNSFNINEYGFY